FFVVAYSRDKIGRISGKVEDVGVSSTSFEYSYDLAGRLTAVKRDGSDLARYEYDSNGNRTAVTSTTGTVLSTFDDQDRLLRAGNTTYAYTAAGELLSKSGNGVTMGFSYDELGGLRTASLPSGLQIEYVVDGRGRRIGKK